MRRWRNRIRWPVFAAFLLAGFLLVFGGRGGISQAQTFLPSGPMRFPTGNFPTLPPAAGNGLNNGCNPNASFAARGCPPAPTPAPPVPTPAPVKTCPPGTIPLQVIPGCQQLPPQIGCPAGTQPVAGAAGCAPIPSPQQPGCPAGTQPTTAGCQTIPTQPVCPAGTQLSASGCQTPSTPVTCPAGTQLSSNGQGCQTVVNTPPAPSTTSTVRCPDGSTAPSASACPSPPVSGGSTSPSLAVTVTISNQNPVKVSLHANEYLDLTHSVIFNLDPAVQASSVQVSTGSATIQGSQVVWNGFTMNAGDDASATVNLVVTGGSTTLMAAGGPSIQSVTIEALDQSGNAVVQFNPGGGPVTGQLTTACSNPSGKTLVTCSGSGVFSTPTFTVSATWDLVWSFGSCPDTTGSLTVTVLNPDGSQMDARTFNQPPASNAGSQHYSASGTFSFSISSPCSWSVQGLQD
jgi:hypothetical protein